jgi:translation initiation factor 6 (eIF-6)
MTARQRAYQKEQRALLQLRRAAVAFCNMVDAQDESALAHIELEGAAMKYANTLSKTDRRRLS